MSSARLPLPSLESPDAGERADPCRGRARQVHDRLAAGATSTDASDCERIAVTLPRDTHYLALARKVVSDCAQRAGFRGDDLDKIELAVDEACSNAIIYQVDGQGLARFHELSVEILIDRPRFTVTLTDRGAPYPFEEQGNFDLEDRLRNLEPGGLGIYIIKNFMDEVVYEHSAREGNVLTMVKYLPRKD